MFEFVKKIIFNMIIMIVSVIAIILFMIYFMIKRTFFEIPQEIKHKAYVRAMNEKKKEYLVNKPWRRLSFWNREDEERVRLTSQEINRKLKVEIKNTIDDLLMEYGFVKIKYHLYRKIKNEIVYEIHISAPYKGQRGIRELTAYIYPLVLVHQNLYQYFKYGEIYYYVISNEECEFEIPFYFDCAVEENLSSSVSDIKELIVNDIFSFFDKYPTMLDLEEVYIRKYKKSSLADLRGFYPIFNNAVFYIAEGKYGEAKKELEQIVTSHEKYITYNHKWLKIYEDALNDPKDCYHSRAKDELEFYQINLKIYNEYYPIMEMLYELIDHEAKIQEWYVKQIVNAKDCLNKEDIWCVRK